MLGADTFIFGHYFSLFISFLLDLVMREEPPGRKYRGLFVRLEKERTPVTFGPGVFFKLMHRGGDMPRARDPKRDEAFDIYKSYNGNIDLVEIANQLSLSPGTVRGWKSKDQWEQKLNGTFRKNTERSQKKNNAKKKAVAKEVEQVLSNTDLTEKQRLFCLYYVRSFNATRAYQKAYGCSYETAMARGSESLRNAKVRDEIYRLKQNRLNREMLDEYDIVQKYMDIAFSDITDFVVFGQETVPVMGAFGPVKVKNEETGKEEVMTKEVNAVRFRESADVDGTLIAEVKQGKDGASIKLLDKMKALEWLTKYFEMNPESKYRKEYDKRRLEIELLKLERDNPEQTKDVENDNFMETLKESAKAVWSNDSNDNRSED